MCDRGTISCHTVSVQPVQVSIFSPYDTLEEADEEECGAHTPNLWEAASAEHPSRVCVCPACGASYAHAFPVFQRAYMVQVDTALQPSYVRYVHDRNVERRERSVHKRMATQRLLVPCMPAEILGRHVRMMHHMQDPNTFY